MGYACPVCETPQRDAEHLANHLAFTAMLHNDDHEAWLDERVEAWSSKNAEELGPVVVEYAAETEYEEVFEDTVHDHGGHGRTGHDHGSPFEGGQNANPGFNAAAAAGMGDETLDDDARSVLREARELTEQMRAERSESEGPSDADESTGENDAAESDGTDDSGE